MILRSLIVLGLIARHPITGTLLVVYIADL